MSNKTRLQTNNSNLQQLINKANSLPDVGGSSGGGSESCTVNITPASNGAVYYMYNGQCLSRDVFGLESITITVTKNTILTMNQCWSSMSSSSANAVLLFYNMANAAYEIHGDCILIGQDGPA